MMRKFLGFTLAELIMTLAIIGILTAAAVNTIKPNEKGIKYMYSNIFHTLDRAYMNAMEDYVPSHANTNPFGTDANDNNTAPARLCTILTQYITSTDDGGSCNTNNAVGNTGEDLSNNRIKFIAINGVRFYISRRYTVSAADYNDIQYFIVYADLNGERGPNTLRSTDKADPDIFPFIFLKDPPRVLPIGIAEKNPKFLLTRIVSVQADAPDDIHYEAESYPYYINKARAWGYYLKDKCSGSAVSPYAADNSTQQIGILDGEPFSYNDVIRKDIETKTSVNNIITNPVRDLSYSGEIDNNTTSQQHEGCSCADTDACWVSVDKYAF